MICFFCALPYQVITCLNMALFDFKDKKKCLVLFNAFKGYKDVYDVCKASDIFEEVFSIIVVGGLLSYLLHSLVSSS